MRAPNQKIIQTIQSVISKENISRLKIQSVVKKNKVIIALLETHTQGILSLALAKRLLKKLTIELVAIESPIEATKNLEDKSYGGYEFINDAGELEEDEDYCDELECFSENAEKHKIPVVCMDQPDDAPEQDNEGDQGLLNPLLESSRKKAELLDDLRNDYMAHTLYHFTNAVKILTITGKSHTQGLFNKYRLTDESVKIVGIDIDETEVNQAIISEKRMGKEVLISISLANEDQLSPEFMLKLVALIEEKIKAQSLEVKSTGTTNKTDSQPSKLISDQNFLAPPSIPQLDLPTGQVNTQIPLTFSLNLDFFKSPAKETKVSEAAKEKEKEKEKTLGKRKAENSSKLETKRTRL